MKRERSVRGPEPTIDIQGVTSRIKTGDDLAVAELDGYLRPMLDQYFARRLPDRAEDLTQDTLIEVYAALNRFEPRGKGDFAKSFNSWTFTIARNNLYLELRKVLGKPVRTFSEIKMKDGSTMAD